MNAELEQVDYFKMKKEASDKGYYIWSSPGDAGLGHFEKTPSAYIQSSIHGTLNMDNFQVETEEKAISLAFTFINDYIFKNGSDRMFVEAYRKDRFHAQKLYCKFIDTIDRERAKEIDKNWGELGRIEKLLVSKNYESKKDL